MPTALTAILRSKTPPPESDADRARRLETARGDLEWSLSDYANAVAALERQTAEVQTAQAEYSVATSSRTLSKDEIAIPLGALDNTTNVRDQMLSELRNREQALTDRATHFHGLFYLENRRETERWSQIIADRVRKAAEFEIDGKPLQSRDSSQRDFLPPQVLAQVLRFSDTMRQLEHLLPTPIQRAPWEPPRDTQWWVSLSRELLQKWDALKAIKAKS